MYSSYRRTKILVTLGPSSEDKDMLKKLLKFGVDGVRFNFAHGSVEYFGGLVDKIREIEDEEGLYIPIMGDLKGPTMRIGLTTQRNLREGENVYFVNKDESKSEDEIPIPDRRLFDIISPNDTILIDDGKIEVLAKRKGEKIEGIVLRGGQVRSNVTIAIRGKEPDVPVISKNDLKYLDFACKEKLDMIALSFVRTKEDVQKLRQELKKRGHERAIIVSKIETKSAITNLESIVKESDFILVARGDLGMHYSLEKIPVLQREIIEISRLHGKPTILATQLLESMIWNPIPTRSEISDIYIGVQEGVDVMMLSGETAIGKFPLEAVKWLEKTIREAEKNYSPERVYVVGETIYDKFALGTVLLAENMGAKILAYTKEGQTARRISMYRPKVPVYTFVQSPEIFKRIKMLYGIYPLLVDKADISEALREGKRVLIENKVLKSGDIIIKTAGLRKMTTDTLEIEIIK